MLFSKKKLLLYNETLAKFQSTEDDDHDQKIEVVKSFLCKNNFFIKTT